MRTRIGSKNYDTETAEFITETVFGTIYRKRTRAREYFFLPNGGSIQPLTNQEALAMLGESSARPKPKPEPQEYRIRIDRETYDRIAAAAEAQSLPMAAIVRQLSQTL